MKKSRLLGVVCAYSLVCCQIGSVHAGLLYAVNDQTDTLVSIDTDTLGVTSIGSLGVTFSFGGLAFDPNTDTLFMIGGRNNENLYTLDRTTGQASLIGGYAVSDLFGLAFDSTNNVLYGAQYQGGSTGTGLYSLNTTTGNATNISTILPRNIDGLAYDSNRDVLVGMNASFGDLYSIDRSTGASTLLIDYLFVSNSGLAYDPDKDLFWNVDYNGNLFSYDPNNSYSRATALTGLGALDALAYVSSIPVPAAAWLFGSGLLGLVGMARRKKVA